MTISKEYSVNSLFRVLFWIFLALFTVWLYPDNDSYFWIILSLAICASCIYFIFDLKNSVSFAFSLHNILWLSILLYGLTFYIISSFINLSLLFNITDFSIKYGAFISILSISICGITLELLRPTAVRLHMIILNQFSAQPYSRQYYLALFFLIIYAYNYINTGVLFLISTESRLIITVAFESGKMWLIQYLMTGVSIAFIYEYFFSNKRKNFQFYIGIFSISFFWILYASLGSRRGLLSVVIALTFCYLARKGRRFGSRAIFCFIGICLLFGFIAVIRQNTSDSTEENALAIQLSNIFGEFIYPTFTLIDSIQYQLQPSFEFTWISNLFYFFSSVIRGEPFLFLAHSFAINVASPNSEVLGYAYLPITEGYNNFGFIGSLISTSVLLSSVIILAILFQSYSWVYLILIALSLDINRSEFASMLIQFLIVVLGFLLTAKFNFCLKIKAKSAVN